jgi:hypothetical protein
VSPAEIGAAAREDRADLAADDVWTVAAIGALAFMMADVALEVIATASAF